MCDKLIITEQNKQIELLNQTVSLLYEKCDLQSNLIDTLNNQIEYLNTINYLNVDIKKDYNKLVLKTTEQNELLIKEINKIKEKMFVYRLKKFFKILGI